MECVLWDGQGEKKVKANRFTGNHGRRFFAFTGGSAGKRSGWTASISHDTRMSPLFKIFRLLLYEVKLKSKSKSKIIEWIPLSGLIYFLVCIGYYFWMRGHDFSSFNSISAAGQFGDMFGAFNALFTGLAFVGLAITIWLQVEQFAEDKLDARNSQIETTFFSMMGNLQRIVETAYFNDESEGRVYSGREYFRFALNLLEGAYRSEIYKFQQVRFQS